MSLAARTYALNQDFHVGTLVDEKRHPLQRSSPKRDSMHISDYRTKEWNFSDPLHLHRLALEEHGVAPWTVTGNIPVPIEHQREFRIPWLTREHGITFGLKIEAIRTCRRRV
jgi:hypothetical protein